MLEPIKCEKCKSLLKPRSGPAKPAHDFASCLRRCDPCGIGYSNSRSRSTIIYRSPEENVPAAYRTGLLDTLANSVNIRNRKNKLAKFSFSTSEDALTWVAFRHLELTGSLNRFLEYLPVQTTQQPQLHLWGVATNQECSSEIPARLESASQAFRERPDSRTEPDVVLHIPNELVVFVEVKLRSPNEITSSTTKPRPYVELGSNWFKNTALAFSSQHYELIRNWTIGNTVARDEKFVLVNLAPHRLFSDKRSKMLEAFEQSIEQQPRSHCFVRLAWEDLCDDGVFSGPTEAEWICSRLGVSKSAST